MRVIVYYKEKECRLFCNSGYFLLRCRLATPDVLLFCFDFIKTGASQNARQRIIAFMTSVFIKLVLGSLHGNFCAPLLNKGIGVVDREAVVDGVIADSRKALDRTETV